MRLSGSRGCGWHPGRAGRLGRRLPVSGVGLAGLFRQREGKGRHAHLVAGGNPGKGLGPGAVEPDLACADPAVEERLGKPEAPLEQGYELEAGFAGVGLYGGGLGRRAVGGVLLFGHGVCASAWARTC